MAGLKKKRKQQQPAKPMVTGNKPPVEITRDIPVSPTTDAQVTNTDDPSLDHLATWPTVRQG